MKSKIIKGFLVAFLAAFYISIYPAAQWSPEKPLEPYSTKGVMLSSSEVLVFSAENSSIFLADYSAKAPAFEKLADLKQPSGISEVAGFKSPSGQLVAGYLELSEGTQRLKCISRSGSGTAAVTELVVFPKGLFPRNLTIAPYGDGGAVFFYILSKADYRDHFYATSWDKLHYVCFSPGSAPAEKELYPMEAVHPGAYSAAISGQEWTIARYSFRRGRMDLLLSTFRPDGSPVSEKVLTSFDPGSKKQRAQLQLWIPPSGQEILALYSFGQSRTFYRIDRTGTNQIKRSLPSDLDLLGTCVEESQLIMTQRNSTQLHWLSKSGDGFCDEAFTPPQEIVRITQSAGGCYYWLENAAGGPSLKKYCKKGC